MLFDIVLEPIAQVSGRTELQVDALYHTPVFVDCSLALLLEEMFIHPDYMR